MTDSSGPCSTSSRRSELIAAVVVSGAGSACLARAGDRIQTPQARHVARARRLRRRTQIVFRRRKRGARGEAFRCACSSAFFGERGGGRFARRRSARGRGAFCFGTATATATATVARPLCFSHKAVALLRCSLKNAERGAGVERLPAGAALAAPEYDLLIACETPRTQPLSPSRDTPDPTAWQRGRHLPGRPGRAPFRQAAG